jgi:hypothetical protein
MVAAIVGCDQWRSHGISGSSNSNDGGCVSKGFNGLAGGGLIILGVDGDDVMALEDHHQGSPCPSHHWKAKSHLMTSEPAVPALCRWADS